MAIDLNDPNVRSGATIGGAAVVAALVSGLMAPSSSTTTTDTIAPTSTSEQSVPPRECKAKEGTYASEADIDTTGCARIFRAERPASLLECGDDRSSLIVHHQPSDALLIIDCALAVPN